MNPMKRICSLIFTFLVIVGNSYSQNHKYSVSNKSAIRYYEVATQYYDSYRNDEALSELDKALNKEPDFVEAYILKANIYVDKGMLEEAIRQYYLSFEVNPDFYPNSFYTLANIELALGRYEDALKNYKHFSALPGASAAMRAKASAKAESCNFAMQSLENPVPFDPENLGVNINSELDEYFPSITVDNSTFIYTRNRPDPSVMGRLHEDFYISTRDNGEWGPSRNAGADLNTRGNEGVPNLSADGKLLFFAACERKDGMGSCDLYYSRLRNGEWSKPINLGYPVNTGAWESQPSFSSDGRTLYFIRGRITGKGIREQDIYTTRISDEGKWSTPEKLPLNINTDGEEEFVFIHPDDRTLYFSSDSHIGMGNLDIYVSRRNDDGSWGDPVNLGYPINTFRDERGLLVGPEGTTAYISSNREGGFGGLDLYSFELPVESRPMKLSYVKAVVTDAQTGEPLYADYEIHDLQSGKMIMKDGTDRYNGELIACLTAGKNYSLNVSKEGYLFYSDHFECEDPSDIRNAYVLEVKMQRAVTGNKVVLKNIFFDTNKYELKPESELELDKLIRFLVANPSVSIELEGHTDNVGDKVSNQQLSESRARAVYDHLISKGIKEHRLNYKGYGESQPVADNDTEEGRARNRRTEFRIL
jgi:outer membrane protein OmpA-like peptidoglycan-associated protein/predicted negative regulator of RcsB-dependent stress response